eukprot:CAMPEP_0180757978 /NCGR_PEP_ID=MMETSP1038_2-20121128/35043_1 /TAXON_ID=632150 /ORGANISM="Azadinium spinosum, Strain 3D9" /LENGTH=64 /DNA_ID=CAMNT_0022792045 /DNA_START=306 /DNA_END=496 /DNA_ORIENTATION=-
MLCPTSKSAKGVALDVTRLCKRVPQCKGATLSAILALTKAPGPGLTSAATRNSHPMATTEVVLR